MLYVSYHHKRDTTRELVLPDGAPFPHQFRQDEWYVHATHRGVSGRTEADIASFGYCLRSTGLSFGRRVGVPHPAPRPRLAAN